MSVYKVTYRRFHTEESINIYELLETYKIIPALLGDTYTRGKLILKCRKMTYIQFKRMDTSEGQGGSVIEGDSGDFKRH